MLSGAPAGSRVGAEPEARERGDADDDGVGPAPPAGGRGGGVPGALLPALRHLQLRERSGRHIPAAGWVWALRDRPPALGPVFKTRGSAHYKDRVLNSDELHELCEGLKPNHRNKYDSVLMVT